MKIINFDRQTHYKIAAEWWKKRNYEVIPLGFLPSNGYAITTNDNVPVAMGFLMRSDCGLAGPCHLVTNPSAANTDRSAALDLLIDQLVERAKELGFKVIAAETNVESLVKRYQAKGFKITDRGLAAMMKVV